MWPRVQFWVLSRVVVIVSILLIGSLFTFGPAEWDVNVGWAAQRLASYDSGHFLRIAEIGYFTADYQCCTQAFLPGYPLAMKALAPFLGGHEIWAGMLITVIAGVVAAALLWRLAAEHGGPAAGQVAVAAFALHPVTVFMAVVYSEALFFALALGAWFLAGRGRWWWAGLLAAAGTSMRINGLFLLTALALMFLMQMRRRKPAVRWYDAGALVLPVVPIAVYFTWLHAQTGSWTAWLDAEKTGWDRRLAPPWTGVASGWDSAFGEGRVSLPEAADLLAVIIGLMVTAALVALKRWPEAVYMALNMTVLICSTTLTSANRYSLTWFPLYTLLGQLLAAPERRRWRTIAATSALPLVAYGTAAWTVLAFIG